MSKILITGGTGSLGSALVKHWYGKHELTIVSRDSHKQARMTAEYPANQYILADICNMSAMRRACRGQDILIHAAAAKDVSTGEYHPEEFARVNVMGSILLAGLWGGRQALLISSDKEVSCLNCYGATKKIATSVFRKYGFSVLRYGNVIESNGSFVHKWQAAIKVGEPVTIREPEPTRFYLSMPGAIALIEEALSFTAPGIFVPHGLKSFSVWDVAWALKAQTQKAPLLPYEKQHEALLAEGETADKVGELLSRVTPGWDSKHIEFRSNVAPRMTGYEILEALGW